MDRLFKNKARKAYNDGIIIYMVPCKMYPCSPWGFTFTLDKTERLNAGKEADFDRIVQEFEWYNCVYETGYYSAFYTNKQGDVHA